MEKKEYRTMFAVEESHFWYRGMRLITHALLDKYLSKTDNQILDAGCGTGFNMQWLKRYGQVHGCDISPLAVSFCHRRKLTSVKVGSINKLPYRPNMFDMVVCFDVLGQKEVSSAPLAIKEFYRILKPGGIVFLRTAALNCLFSSHDRHVHTKHRYHHRELKQLFSGKFSLIRLSYANSLLLPFVWLLRIRGKLFYRNIRKSDVGRLAPIINYLMYFPLLIESRLLKYIDLPVGSSLIVIARKGLTGNGRE